MVIGFWISLFIFIISLILLVTLSIVNIHYWGYSDAPYYVFGVLIAISLFFVIFCGYYSNLFN